MDSQKWLQGLDELERSIGYSFHDRSYLITALTHSSFVKADGASADYNERIEFLGDAVLELTVSEKIYAAYPELNEGELTRLRARLVCEQALFRAAQPLKLAAFLRLGRGEEHSGGREKPSVVSDAVEAVIGAIYLDGGIDRARAFVNAHIIRELTSVPDFGEDKDYKTRLQEYAQKRHMDKISYVLVGAEGPDHLKVFTMEVFIGELSYGTGTGKTKQSAGQVAAGVALERLMSETSEGGLTDAAE